MKILCQNRKVEFEYFIEETLEVGIALLGSEVKSLRLGSGSIVNSHVAFESNRLVIHNFFIPPYKFAPADTAHDPLRVKMLLAHKKEMLKLKNKIKTKGLTVIPAKVYLNRKQKIKLEIVLAKGKKLHDKRRDIKKKDLERDQRRENSRL